MRFKPSIPPFSLHLSSRKMQLDFVVVERYILNRAGRGLQDRFRLCFWRWRAKGLPTRKALRRSRRCNLCLRVFFVIYATSFLSESTAVVLSNRPTWHLHIWKQKKIGYHITYDTRLIRKKNTECHNTWGTRFYFL